MIDIMKSSVSLFIKPVVIVFFWLNRWHKNNHFLQELQNSNIGRPSKIFALVNFFYRGFRFVVTIGKSMYVDYALRLYKDYVKQHYAAGGVGYFNYDELTEKERSAEYLRMKSRLAYYIDDNSSVLDYRDGYSFLEIGCGKGQNIKELVQRFPSSKIRGFDPNNGALEICRTGLKGVGNVEVEIGNATDPDFWQRFSENEVDHVVISHVLSFLTAEDLAATRRLRQYIVDQLLRVADRTVIVLDSSFLVEKGEATIAIEQNTRCFLRESLEPYFANSQYKGELYVAFSLEDQSLIFKKKKSQ